MDKRQEDVSLKDLILGIKKYISILKKNWIIISIISIISLSFFVYKTYTTPPYYLGQINYVSQNEDSGGMGALGGLLGSVGIKSGGKTNPNQVIEVSTSKQLISEIMFSKSSCDGDYLANNIIEAYKLDEIWASYKPDMLNYRFTNADYLNFKGDDRSAFLTLYGKILGPSRDKEKALLQSKFNNETRIYSLLSKSERECITLDLVNIAYDKLKNFFENEMQEDREKSASLLLTKRDSIYGVIKYKMDEVARFQDSNRGSLRAIDQIEIDRLQLEIRNLGVAYAEINKNYELADMNNKTLKPKFTALDRPYAPLFAFRQNLIINIILGLLLGLFIGAIIVIIRNVYHEALAS